MRKIAWMLITAFLLIGPYKAMANDQPEKLIMMTAEMGLPELTAAVTKLTAYFDHHIELKIEEVIMPSWRLHANLAGELPGCSLVIIRIPGFEPEIDWIRQTTQVQISEFRVTKRYSDIKDAVKQPILLMRGSASEAVAKHFDLTYISVNARQQIFDMLANGRSNNWLTLDIAAEFVDAKREGFELTHIQDLMSAGVWLTCSPQISNAVKNKLGEIWDNGAKNGDIEALFYEFGIQNYMPNGIKQLHTQ